MRTGVGLSLRPEPVLAALEAAGRAAIAAGPGRTAAALVWLTHHHADALPRIWEQLRRRLGIETLAGGVVPGVIAGDCEVFDAPAVAAMCFRGAGQARFESLLVRGLSERNEAAAEALGSGLQGGDLGIALLSTAGFRPAAFEAGLAEFPEDRCVVGGGAVNLLGPDWVFTEQGAHEDALAALIVRGCRPRVGLSHSCRVLAPPQLVTGSRGRLLASLDGKPAARALVQLAQKLKLSEEDFGRRVMVCLTDEPGTADLARGDFVVRPLLGVDPRLGALYLGGEVPEGSWLAFVLRDPAFARLDLNAMAMELGAHARRAGARGFAVVADCSGRGPAFQGMPEHDGPILAAQLAPVPLGGFFSGFELAPKPKAPASVHLFSCAVAVGT